MASLTNRTLEYCEETKSYHFSDAVYPKYMTLFRDRMYHVYEELNVEKTKSDGTEYIPALKVYQKVSNEYHMNNLQEYYLNKNKEIQNELPQALNLNKDETSQNGIKNVSHQKKSCNSVKNKKCSKSTALNDKQSKQSSSHQPSTSAVNLNYGNSDRKIDVKNKPTGSIIKSSRLKMAKKKSADSRSCGLKCLMKMNRNYIQHLSYKFCTLNDRNKTSFINKLIRKRLTLKNDLGNQKVIDQYHIPFKNRLIKVCKSCFMKTFIMGPTYYLTVHEIKILDVLN